MIDTNKNTLKYVKYNILAPPGASGSMFYRVSLTQFRSIPSYLKLRYAATKQGKFALTVDGVISARSVV